jgi:hypothetical protein
VTLLREPIDRTISWLYFVTRNHRPADLPELYDACVAYLDSGGKDLRPELKGYLVNPAVRHFAAILGDRSAGGTELVETAFRAISAYDCLGIYERLDDFVASLAALIGVPAPESLQAVNVTKKRPEASAIDASLRDNIRSITSLDQELYARVTVLVDERMSTRRPKPPAKSKWARYERPATAKLTTPALTLHKIRPLHDLPVTIGSVMRFQLDFELHEPVNLLEAGFHILDDRKRWAFGVNNLLLGQQFSDLPPGRYRLDHFVTAELAAGHYTIGFAFADVGGESKRSLHWHDGLLPIHVRRPAECVGGGSAVCSARMMFVHRNEAGTAAAASRGGDPDVAQRAA